MIAGAGMMASNPFALPKTVDIATANVYTSPTTPFSTATGRGFDAGDDFYGASSFGSIDTDIYLDNGSNERQITACYWSSFNFMHITIHAVSGGAPPDTDATFAVLEFGSGSWNRSAMSSGTTGTNSRYWVISEGTAPIGTTGDATLNLTF